MKKVTQQIFRNLFHGGLNSDTSPTNAQNTEYISASNLTLIGDSKYTTLQNIKGTTKISDITTATSSDVLGVYENIYTIGATTGVKCLTIFTDTSSGYFQVFCYDLDNNVLYKLYRELSEFWNNTDKVIDAVSYAEEGADAIYFTDNIHEIRKIKCIIPAGSPDWFMTETEIGLTKRRSIGQIILSDIVSGGGNLLSGTYQLAYQLIHPTKNKYTNWSLLTTPIHVYSELETRLYHTNALESIPTAGIGLPSDKSIQINIYPSDEELEEYTHFRVAVVENINPEGVQSTEIGLTKIEAIADYFLDPYIWQYEIKSNVQLDTVTLDEITIDLAAVETVKSLAISNNRLLAGNVTYRNLEYNNGDPEITSGSILTKTGSDVSPAVVGDSFSSDKFSSFYKGHFRGEVYRYAISYYDKYGNFSYPKTLDMSSVTNNQIVDAIDMKFPTRNQAGGIYTPLFYDGTHRTQSLGLQLVGIDNHPTWARGFVILRAKRKKNILFQTPMINMSLIEGIGAVGKYPTTAREGAASPADVSYPSATPMGPSSTLHPYNLFYGTATNIVLHRGGTVGTGADKVINGEAYQGVQYGSHFVMLYPDVNMYSGYSNYSFSGNEQLDVVDIATTRLYVRKFNDTSYTPNLGNSAESSCSGSFFATRMWDYTLKYGNSYGNPQAFNYTITSTKPFDNYTTGSVINGQPVLDYAKLTTPTVALGFTPNSQRGTVAALNIAATNILSYPFDVGVPVKVGSSASTLFGSGYPHGAYADEALTSNNFITDTAGLYAGGGSVINQIPIVNCISGLDDKRYGEPTDYNEFIFTGTQFTFRSTDLDDVASGASLPVTVDVWGGDCIVSLHCFKVADTTYSVMNQEKMHTGATGMTQASAITNWGRCFVTDNTDLSVIGIPVALKNAAQYLSVILESEFHGSVRDIDTNEYINLYDGFPIRGASTETTARSPLTYNSNINLNKQNDQKIFVPIDPSAPVTTDYKSRILYSDLKIYQSTIDGFNSFPVLNYYDLPESFGSLHKLSISNEALYALQERGIAYIPMGERVVELSNTAQLGVRTGEILSKYLYLTTKGGTQHIRSVVSTGNSIFVFDNFNKSIYHIQGSSVTDITEGILSKSRNTYFTSAIPEKQIYGTYDPVRNEYWISNSDGSFCLVYNQDFKKWISNYTFSSGFKGGLFTKDKLYVLGNNAGNYALETMYTGNPTQFFGNYATNVFVEFYVNPIPTTGKVFDDLLIASSDRLDTVDMTIEREAALTNQVVTGIDVDVTTRGEGNYRAKVLRDSGNARLRGIYATTKINWRTGASNPQVNLYAVDTKFRPSENVY